jgi:mRNA interferase MazF
MNRGDIMLVSLPPPPGGGHEQGGQRPALVVHDNSTSNILPVIIIIPFTTQLEALRFPHAIRVEPSEENGLTQISVLMVFQLRAIDKKRLLCKIGRLEKDILETVDAEIRQMLGLSLS